jgi:Immunoglobulin-like domain of bacterial spore germination
MSEDTPENAPGASGTRRRGLLIGAGAVLSVLAIAIVIYAVTRDESDSHPTAATSTTAAANPTPPTTTPVDTSTAVWPVASSSTRYSDAVSAARGFATDYVGFTDAIVGEFRPGDARSGEVPVQATATGPVTTVLVRQLGDSWWVLGSSTPNIQLTSPSTLTAISSPVHLQGTSTAFEATVNAQVRQDGVTEPLGRGTVMGGSNGLMGPFEGTLEFAAPAPGSAGALVLLTLSAQDGHVSEATVVRVMFS